MSPRNDSEQLADVQRERHVVQLLEQARESDRAPDRLRARIEAQRARVQPRRPARVRGRLAYGGALACALAGAIVALALLLPGGTPGSPTVSQAAALAARGPAAPAPSPDPQHPQSRLAQGVDDVYFPNWTRELGWRATGQRVDRIGGRRAVTVYYRWRGRQIAYTIVGGPPLRPPAVRPFTVDRLELRAVSGGGRSIVTWRRGGDTCILSGRGVTAQVLGRLASWRDEG